MWAGCVLGVVLRLLLYAAGAPSYLEEHLALTSPMTSYVRLKECFFLLDAGASPYAGDTCHYPPLLLKALSPFRDSAFAHFLMLVVIDVATALLLRRMAMQYAAARVRAGKPWADAGEKLPDLAELKDQEDSGASPDVVPVLLPPVAPGLEKVVGPNFVGLSYLLNPITLASCLSLSSQNIQHLMLCATICSAGAGRGGAAAVALAISLYVFPFTPLVLVLSCAYLAFAQQGDWSDEASGNGRRYDGRKYVRSKDTKVHEPGFVAYLVRFSIMLVLLLCCLVGASLAITGGEPHFLDACYASVVLVRDLTPNVGLFWYIFIEVFDRFRSLFLFSFNAHIFFYPWPLHMRLGRHRPIGPWLHCLVCIGILGVYKPYPTASDHALTMSVLLIPVELLRESQKLFAFLTSGLLFGLCMFPTMTSVWLGRNAGNANFLFNMTLVINVFGSLLLSEWVRAGLRLRRRQHLSSFCRQVVLDTLERVLDGERPDENTELDDVSAEEVADVTSEGLRRRN